MEKPLKSPKNSVLPITSDVFETSYKRLNKGQKEAVDAIEGAVMVIAGPGTGKTTILALRVANILLKTDTKPENILALTFTEAGVIQMKRKLQEIMGAVGARVHVHTFHSFAISVIERNEEMFGTIAGFSAASDEDQIKIIENILAELHLPILKPFGDPTRNIHAIKSIISDLKKEKISPQDLTNIVEQQEKDFLEIPDLYNTKGAYEGKMKDKYIKLQKKIEKNKELIEVYIKYQAALVSQKLYDFDDMLLYVIDAMQQENGLLFDLQETYQYILADEHQDANGSQNTILELLASFHDNPNLFIVGDEKQAIYRFQGASLNNFLYFHKKYPQAKLIMLTENYRSTQHILDVAHNLISQSVNEIVDVSDKHKKSKGKELTVNDILKLSRAELQAKSAHAAEEGKKLSVMSAEFTDQANEIEFIAQNILAKKTAGVPLAEIAVIYRNNKHAEEIAAALSRNGISYNISSRNNLLQDLFIQRMIALFKMFADPADAVIFNQGLLSGFTSVPILNIFSYIKVANEGRKKLSEVVFENESEFKEIFQDLVQAAAELPVHTWFARVSQTFQIPEQAIALKDGMLSVEKLSSFNEYIESYQIKNSKAKLIDFINHISFMVRHNIPIKQSIRFVEHKVQLMTAHGSKGLEYEYVYIAHLQEGIWSNLRDRSNFIIPGVEDDVSDEEKREDERRLLYVAMTRAKKELWILSSKNLLEGKESITSQFLDEIGLDNVQHIDVSDFETEQAKQPLKSLMQKGTLQQLFDLPYIQDLFLSRSISVTALNNYFTCPAQYFWRNLIRIPDEPNRSMRYGTATHETIERFLKDIKDKKYNAEYAKQQHNVIEKYFIESLDHLPVVQQDYDAIKMQGIKSIPLFAEFVLDKLCESLEISKNDLLLGKTTVDLSQYIYPEFSISQAHHDVNFDGKIYSIKLSGKLDAVLRHRHDPDLVSVFDYKTTKGKSRNEIEGKTKDSDGGYKRQLVFYKYLLDKQGMYNMRDASLLFTEPDEKGNYRMETFNISAEEISGLMDEINIFATEIMSGQFLDKGCNKKDCDHCKQLGALKNFRNFKRA